MTPKKRLVIRKRMCRDCLREFETDMKHAKYCYPCRIKRSPARRHDIDGSPMRLKKMKGGKR